jgi:hypothetical protein
MADKECKHAQELIMMLSEGGHESLLIMRGETNSRPMSKSERIIDVITWSYRKESPFSGVMGQQNGCYDPRRAPCHSCHATHAQPGALMGEEKNPRRKSVSNDARGSWILV